MKQRLLRLCFWLALGFWTVCPASAATLTVTSTNDSGPRSLRQAIQDASAGDSINFAVADIGAFEFQVASVPLYVTGLTKLGNSALQLAFTNTPGATFTVLACTNDSLLLSNRTVLGAPTEIGPGQFQFTDAQATNNPQKFYRLCSP